MNWTQIRLVGVSAWKWIHGKKSPWPKVLFPSGRVVWRDFYERDGSKVQQSENTGWSIYRASVGDHRWQKVVKRAQPDYAGRSSDNRVAVKNHCARWIYWFRLTVELHRKFVVSRSSKNNWDISLKSLFTSRVVYSASSQAVLKPIQCDCWVWPGMLKRTELTRWRKISCRCAGDWIKVTSMVKTA